MNELNQSVLTGVITYPGHAFCRNRYVRQMEAAAEHARSHGIEVDLHVVWNGHEPIWGFDDWDVDVYEEQQDDRGVDILVKKQNMIYEKFMSGNYTHLFMSESDVIPPVDIIQAFVDYDKDIVCSPYTVESQDFANMKIPLDNPKFAQWKDAGIDRAIFQRNRDLPALWGVFGQNGRMMQWSDILPAEGLVRVVASGLGAMLIKRKVLEEVGRFRLRNEEKKHTQFTDFLFGIASYQAGFQMFTDPSRISGHLHYDFDEDMLFTKWFDPQTADPGVEQ